MLSLCLAIQRGMRVTPLGFCLRVIVNKKPLNLEMTTFSVLSVLLLICFSLENSNGYKTRKNLQIKVYKRPDNIHPYLLSSG